VTPILFPNAGQFKSAVAVNHPLERFFRQSFWFFPQFAVKGCSCVKSQTECIFDFENGVEARTSLSGERLVKTFAG
jgi:hypothetical protein